jgi:hypothetical protein
MSPPGWQLCLHNVEDFGREDHVPAYGGVLILFVATQCEVIHHLTVAATKGIAVISNDLLPKQNSLGLQPCFISYGVHIYLSPSYWSQIASIAFAALF